MKQLSIACAAALGLAIAVEPSITIRTSGMAFAAGAKGHDGPRVHRFGVVSRSTAGTVRIIRISRAKFGTGRTVATVPTVKVFRFGRSKDAGTRDVKTRISSLPLSRFAAFALPDQTYFPPYYRAYRAYGRGPDMTSRLEGGRTVRQGSSWRGEIKAARTVEQGARRRGTIRGGRTVEQGSPYRSRIAAGRTVEKGSPWASTMRNWRFSGYAAPVRPKGIPYYRSRRQSRSPWASRLY